MTELRKTSSLVHCLYFFFLNDNQLPEVLQLLMFAFFLFILKLHRFYGQKQKPSGCFPVVTYKAQKLNIIHFSHKDDSGTEDQFQLKSLCDSRTRTGRLQLVQSEPPMQDFPLLSEDFFFIYFQLMELDKSRDNQKIDILL